MAVRRWVEYTVMALRESLGPVTVELNELDWQAAASPQRERFVEHLIAMPGPPSGA